MNSAAAGKDAADVVATKRKSMKSIREPHDEYRDP